MAKTTSTPGRVKLRRKTLKNGAVSLYLDTFIDGRRTYEFLKLYLTGDKVADAQKLRIAEATRMKRELHLLSAEHDVPMTGSDEDLLEFFEHTTALRPYYNFRSALRLLREFTGGPFPMKAVKKEWARQFRDYLIEKCRTSNTAAMYWCCMRVVIREGREQGKIIGNPIEGIKSPKREPGPRPFLTIEELRAIAKAPCRHLEPVMHVEVRRAFLFACYTGLRYGDVKALTWEAIDAKSVKLRMEKTADMVVIPLTDQVRELLGPRGSRDQRVFTLSTQAVTWRHLRRWAESAGIDKKIGFHTARHTFATLALSNDVDIFTVSKLLGHRSVRETQVYTKLIDRKREEAVTKLPRL